MECFKIENLTFGYPDCKKAALEEISFTVKKGEFITLIGKSGCGKTTLLRLLKPSVSPFGEESGNIFFMGENIKTLEKEKEAAKIGFVMQSPDNQIVTDKVWHELAFGLESLGMKREEIRLRVAEMASFFGIQNWFHKNVSELSGGQKQILNLASVMVMQPECLILDEPTSQLDPIAASEFLKTLEKINKELGTTVILSEHRLEEAIALSDRIIVLDNGKLMADGTADCICGVLKEKKHGMYLSLPTPAKIATALSEKVENIPLNIRDGVSWLSEYSENHPYDDSVTGTDKKREITDVSIELKDVYFRYKRELPDVLSALSLKVYKGEIYSILGGNGTGKTTTMSVMGGILKPYSGKVLIDGKEIEKTENLYGKIGFLTQNPELLFTEKTVMEDLLAAVKGEDAENIVIDMARLLKIDGLLRMHPYDLSGGEKQRAALCKILLKNPSILLLDEPTKGMDGEFKKIFSGILSKLKKMGKTIVIVSHDIEFCAENSDYCTMFFDGGIVSGDTPGKFFSGKNFYTTEANKMGRGILPKAYLTEEIVKAFGGEMPVICNDDTDVFKAIKREKDVHEKKKIKIGKNIFIGSLFAIIFLLLQILLGDYFVGWKNHAVQILSLVFLALSLSAFFPQKEFDVSKVEKGERSRKSLVAVIIVSLIIIPLTLWLGTEFLQNKKYYFTSLIIIAETILPFLFLFEKRKPKARELVVISTLAALAVAGRSAFFMVASFKPVLALIIITGVTLGGETGFLVGAITAFVSNFFFGQGPWTPWQMAAFAVIGCLAGIIFSSGMIKRSRLSLCIFGAFAALFIYGGIMNPASVLTISAETSKDAILSSFVLGLPHDIIHAASTFIFLWFISGAMIEKIERIKKKYGLIKM